MAKALSAFLTMGELWVAGLGLAAFLALFWVLRGAPVGQAVALEEDEDSPRGAYRDRVVAAMTIGMMLILTGAYLVVTRGVAWSLAPFLLGFGTVLGLVLINQRHRHGSPTLRRTVDLSTAALNVSLVAGVLIVVNVIAFRYGGRAIDMTREQAFSLSKLTVAQLKSLARPVTFTTFYGRSAAAAQQFDRVQQTLDLYKAVNPEKVKLDHVDPFRDLARYEELVKRVPDVDVTQGGGVVVEYGEGTTADRVVVRNVDLFEIPRAARFDPDAESFASSFKGEDALTTALMRLRDAKKPKVVFVTGHGEPSIEDADPAKPALGVWRSRLAATGSEVFAVNLATQEIPEDAAIVIVVGPRSPFKPDEVAKLRAYGDRKGPMLFLVDAEDVGGLEEFLKGYGVSFGKGIVVDPRQNYRNRAEAMIVPVLNQRDPILEPLNNEVLFVMRASPLTLAGKSQPPGTGAPVLASPLLKTGAQSWAETDINNRRLQKDAADPAGPITIGAAVTEVPGADEPKAQTPRMVVLSSRYLADNPMIQLSPTNLDLLMNAVNWLRGRPDMGGIAPKTHTSLTLTADPAVRTRLILVPTTMAILLIVTLGVTTYLARRA